MNLNPDQWKRLQATKAKRKAPKHDESALQTACVRWFRLSYPRLALLLFSIPNGAKLHGDAVARAKQWQRLVGEGAVAGAADLFLAIPSGDYSGLFIEMKTKKGKQSDTQKAFEAAVVENGFGYAVPRSFDEFEKVVTQYLQNGTY